MNTKRAFFCIFLLWICGGCEHENVTGFASDENFNISISVEKEVYTFNTGPEPKVTLRNDSEREVYFPMSSNVGFEQFKNGRWINYIEWFVVDGIGHSWPLKSGQSMTAAAPFGYFSQEEIPGTYRFKFRVYKDKALKFSLPLNQRVSRPFQVVTRADLITGRFWLWLESYDPYQGGTWYRPDSLSAQHTFVFAKDGSFVEDRPGGCCRQAGMWELQNDEQMLFLHYTDNSNHDLTYELRELTADVLKLAWQGRHGMVVDTYIAQPK